MNNHPQSIKVHNFSAAFEQMCSIIAIGEVGKLDEVLEGLILQSMILLPDDFSSARKFVDVINDVFGISIPEHEIQFALEKLISQETLIRSSGDKFYIENDLRKKLVERVNDAYELEKYIRDSWREEIIEEYPSLDFTQLWVALRHYLARAFQRHGMQTIALLDTSLEIPAEYSESLSRILERIIQSEFPKEMENFAKSAISGFMATTGRYPKRAKYISQLADGAFSFYTLTIPEETSALFKSNLSPLSLFLDTNFLYGILGLTVSPQVAVSNELIDAIQKHKLPFKLCRHPKTIRELETSIDNYANYLSTLSWSRPISRAAAVSRHLSGVEQRYHQVFSETNIDVESFFKPYRHIDVLLDQKNVEPFTPAGENLAEIADLAAQYEEFLASWGKEKSYRRRDHDMTILFEARQLRSSSKSTLEAKALLLTCDYSLYRFDWETSRKSGIKSVTVLPNIFWQVLRPFVSSDNDFDHSFAETFALPEFRIIGSRAAQACSKMVNILAGLKDLSEETAVRMLSNDALIATLEKIDNDQEFKDYIELAIVHENSALVEEKNIISNRLEQEKSQKAQTERELEAEREARIASEHAAKEREESIRTAAKVNIQREQQARIESDSRMRETELSLQKEKKLMDDERAKALQERERFQISIAILVSVICIGAFELLTHLLPIAWIINHPYTLLLQIVIDTVVILTAIAAFVSKWRKTIITIDVLTLVIGSLLAIYLAK